MILQTADYVVPERHEPWVTGGKYSGRDWLPRPTEPSCYTLEMPVRSSGLKQQERLLNEIELSRKILRLHNDWDDEGSVGYQKETWDRAVLFLSNSANFLWERHAMAIDSPSILPGPQGSIDIHWETKKYELLVNISADPNVRATFYGDDKGNLSIKGSLDPNSKNQGLLLWLKNLI